MSSDFVHLRLHTEYSLVDSVVRIDGLMEDLRRQDLKAVALTDQSNVFAMVKFYRAAVAAGIKPLIGADLWLVESPADPAPARLTLLCQNRDGYLNLSQLITKSYAEGQDHGRALVHADWLTEASLGGLIALSGAHEGDVGRAILHGRGDRARRLLAHWGGLMPGRYYLELQRLGRPEEQAYLPVAVSLASELQLPVVATNDVRFLAREDFEAHEARVCIQLGRTLDDATRPRDYVEHQYLKSAGEMAELFADLPEAVANSVEIARRCNLQVELGGVYLPEYPVPARLTTADYLTAQSQEGLAQRLALPADGAPPDAYNRRLTAELDVICRMGFAGYFLIVADFIGWARDNGVPVGPGRGSGAGSLVASALGITDLDPIEHDLLFERFLNPERVSMPDFDVDFCMAGRDRVIEYVTQRYGAERVSQIITYGSMAARAVVRDVGRVLGLPYGFVDRIAKLIPFELGMTLEKALADEELKGVYDTEDEVRTLIDLAKRLEGLARNAGKHAGGVVIAPSALTDFAPLYREEGAAGFVTQFDKDDVEAIGLVKFDFLGLRTLTIIDKAMEHINAARAAAGEEALDIAAIPTDDAKTYELLRSCQTTAVFQLESRGMKDLIKRLQPDQFDDVVALVALFRPGPLQSGMVDDFISRKHGRNQTDIDYLHPQLEAVLKPTYGVILYQEQVMQIAQVLAGYSLGEADLLRRAMGKKKPEEMAKQRSVFIAGALARGVEQARASHIFDLMEKFAGYGFNKSHSAAYALIAYQTAWLKAHYPAQFMAAVMSADMDNTDKLVVIKDDCIQLGLTVEPPDVNRSDYEFTVDGAGRIMYGLGAIKGVGQGVVEALLAERASGGEFTQLGELCRRMDHQKLNRRILETLIRAGALDALGPNRASLMQAAPAVMKRAEQSARAAAAGQNDLFGGSDQGLVEADDDITAIRDWSERDRLKAERESLGLYLTGHPFEQYRVHCRHFTNGSIAAAIAQAPVDGAGAQRQRRSVVLAGLVIDLRRRGSRVTLMLDDNTDRVEVTLFDEAYRQYRHLLAKDEILVVEGTLRFDDFINGWRLAARSVQSIDEVIEAHARRLVIRWSEAGLNGDFVRGLKETLRPFAHGSCDVCIQYQGRSATALVTLGDQWTVRPTRELRDRLSQLLGEEHFALQYPRVSVSLTNRPGP